jgi:hypothetical protein
MFASAKGEGTNQEVQELQELRSDRRKSMRELAIQGKGED